MGSNELTPPERDILGMLVEGAVLRRNIAQDGTWRLWVNGAVYVSYHIREQMVTGLATRKLVHVQADTAMLTDHGRTTYETVSMAAQLREQRRRHAAR